MTTPKINIHEYPENATPRQLADYRHAVECAVLEGGKPELKHNAISMPWTPCRAGLDLEEIAAEGLDWHQYQWRIARDPLDEQFIPYTAETFPKGEVWIRHDEWPEHDRELVWAVVLDRVSCASGSAYFCAGCWQISLDGGRTWQPFRQEVVS
jgi:hypothetical protein